MLRITTANSFAQSITTLQKRQQELNRAQEQMTTGKRVLLASDDPTAAARAERARALMQRTDSTQRALDASRNAMTLTESALGDAGDLLQQARELVVQAGNASYTDAERQDLAQQIAAIRNQLMSVTNRGDGTGGYVFAGQGATQPPFIDRPGGVDFIGTGGAVQVATAEPLPLTLDGQATWMTARSGNGVFTTSAVQSRDAWVDAGRVTNPSLLTGSHYAIEFQDVGGTMSYTVYRDGVATALANQPYTAGTAIEFDGIAVNVSGKPATGDQFAVAPATPDLSVFDVLDNVVNALKTPMQTNGQITQTVQSGLRDIDALRNHIQSQRSMTGEVLNRIDSIEGRNTDLELYAESTRSAAEDLDMVQAISDFEGQQIGYQAALQSYASLQRMSMFDYIKT